MSFVVCCSLFRVRWLLLLVVSCSWSAICCLLVVGCVLIVVCCLMFVDCRLLFVGVLLVVRCLVCVVYRLRFSAG